MDVGAFVCSCADTCDIDLTEAREKIDDVEVVASSRLLCQDKLGGFEQILEEYDLDEVIVTCPEAIAQDKLEQVAEASGVDADDIGFVDQRESAGWVHDRDGATEKTARLVNAALAGRREEKPLRSSIHRAGYDVAVVGDAETAAEMGMSADVTLIANGQELSSDIDLEGVSVQRGVVTDVDGSYGDFTVTFEARVTDDCISCMKCVHAGPDGMVTSYPVDIDPDAPDGRWTDICPTDAIDMQGVERMVACDQVIYPDGSGPRGGQRGFHTGPVDTATITAVERELGGFEGIDFLDLEMEVCAAGSLGEKGCNECVDACPHGAVERAAVDEVEFHLDSCQNCGACTSACPTGATMLREPGNERIAREVEALLASTDDGGIFQGLLGSPDAGIETPIVAFVCSEQAREALREYGRLAASGRANVEYPPILPVSVNCADTVGEAHLLHSLAAGAAGVALVGCGDACLHSGPDPKAELVDRVNQATTDLGLGTRVGFFAPEPGKPDNFVEDLSRFAETEIETSPVPAGEFEATGRIDDPDRENPAFDSHGWTLESVRAILEHAEPERDVIRGLKDFGVVDVGEGCTLTPTCSNYCPTDALRREENGLFFNHERCVNCGLCEEVCVEGVMTVNTGLDLSLLPENGDGEEPAWSRVFEGTMLPCAGCGRQFTSEETAAAIEDRIGDVLDGLGPDTDESIINYCPECRTKFLHEM